jgi:hypothetical protein
MKISRIYPALLTLLLPSFSHASGEIAATPTIDHGLYFVASDVPAKQSQTLQEDLAYLRSLKTPEDSALRSLMEIPGALNGTAMDQWLAERVQYIVSEDLDFNRAITTVLMSFPYPNPRALPLTNSLDNPPDINLDETSNPINGTGKPVVVMMNLGAAFYHHGKRTRSLLGVNVPGMGTVPLSSPRSGIIQIGRGMFMPLFKSLGHGDTSKKLYSVFRLGTLFHEARHSDGNGESLGFLHTYCPIGHDYEGAAACDLSLNGAYVLGAVFQRNITSACAECSTAEKEALKLDVLDSFNRVVKEAPKYSDVAEYSFKCQKAAQKKRTLSSPAENFCQSLATSPTEKAKAAYWDPRPEGSRWKQ